MDSENLSIDTMHANLCEAILTAAKNTGMKQKNKSSKISLLSIREKNPRCYDDCEEAKFEVRLGLKKMQGF